MSYEYSTKKFLKDIGDRLANLRKEKHLTQEELAERLNISRASVYRYETGEIDFKVSILDKYSAEFGVSVDFLLSGHNLDDRKQVLDLLDNLSKTISLLKHKLSQN